MAPAPPAPLGPVLALASNKGGVGKTTLATNLAVYLRALDEELPILVLSLDDQGIVDRLFGLGPAAARPDGHLKHGWAQRNFEPVIRLGQYGIHYVPSAPDTARLKAYAEDPRQLRGILEQTGWPGLVILDTKSDLEALTRNALYAADRVLVPVSDRASLEEAAKVFALVERLTPKRDKARVVLTLVDHRVRLQPEGIELSESLRAEVRRRGWPLLVSSISRSPRVETLHSAGARPRTILHEAQGTRVHREMRALAEEVAADLGLAGRRRRLPRIRESARDAVGLKDLLLRGLGGWLR